MLYTTEIVSSLEALRTSGDFPGGIFKAIVPQELALNEYPFAVWRHRVSYDYSMDTLPHPSIEMFLEVWGRVMDDGPVEASAESAIDHLLNYREGRVYQIKLEAAEDTVESTIPSIGRLLTFSYLVKEL